MNREALHKLGTFNRKDEELIDWTRKLIVNKATVRFASVDVVMSPSNTKIKVDHQKNRFDSVQGPYTRFINYKPYQRKIILKREEELEEEEEPPEDPFEKKEKPADDMNADLGLENKDEENADIRQDEQISAHNKPYLSKQIVTGTISVV
jgi:hypothetical protein